MKLHLQRLQDRPIALLATHVFEQRELVDPIGQLRDTGARSTPFAPRSAPFEAGNTPK